MQRSGFVRRFSYSRSPGRHDTSSLAFKITDSSSILLATSTLQNHYQSILFINRKYSTMIRKGCLKIASSLDSEESAEQPVRKRVQFTLGSGRTIRYDKEESVEAGFVKKEVTRVVRFDMKSTQTIYFSTQRGPRRGLARQSRSSKNLMESSRWDHAMAAKNSMNCKRPVSPPSPVAQSRPCLSNNVSPARPGPTSKKAMSLGLPRMPVRRGSLTNAMPTVRLST